MSQSEPHVEALPRAQRQSGGNVLEKRTRLFSARYGHRKQRRDWILSCSERASADDIDPLCLRRSAGRNCSAKRWISADSTNSGVRPSVHLRVIPNCSSGKAGSWTRLRNWYLLEGYR